MGTITLINSCGPWNSEQPPLGGAPPSHTLASRSAWSFFVPLSPLKGNPCPLVQPPINGKIEPSQAKYTFKDQVVISCNTGYNVLKVPEPLALMGAFGALGQILSSPPPEETWGHWGALHVSGIRARGMSVFKDAYNVLG